MQAIAAVEKVDGTRLLARIATACLSSPCTARYRSFPFSPLQRRTFVIDVVCHGCGGNLPVTATGCSMNSPFCSCARYVASIATLTLVACAARNVSPEDFDERKEASLVSASHWSDRRPGLLAWGTGKLALFGSPDGTDLLSRLLEDGAWSPSVLGDWDPRFMAVAGSPEAISWAPGTIHLFATRGDGSLIFEALDPAYSPRWVLDDRWPHWAAVGKPTGTRLAGQPAVVSWATGRIDVFARGDDSNLYIRSWINGQGWFPPDGSSNLWNSLGGSVASSPSAISWGPNLLHLAVVGASGDMLLKAWNGSWVPSQMGWTSLGRPGVSSFVGRPAMVAWQAGRLDIVARASDGNVYLKSWLADHWVPDPGWVSLGAASGDPVVTTWGPDRLHIAVRQADGTVGLKAYNRTWVPSLSGWTTLGAPPPGLLGQPTMIAPLPASPESEELDIAVYGRDQGIYLKRWLNNAWTPSQTGWTAQTNAVDTTLDQTPFWVGTSMASESALMVDYGDGRGPRANLLVPAQSISKVTNLRGTITYRQGSDWTYDASTNQVRLVGPAAPRLTSGELDASHGAVGEGHFYHDRQLAITYAHANALPATFMTATGREFLTGTRSKLGNHTPLRVIVLGDSISAGLNASGVVGAPPYHPSWAQQLVNQLEDAYGGTVALENPSVPGQTAAWGVQNVAAEVSSHAPDLVVVAFGMNDSAGGPAGACAFETNIGNIVDSIHGATSAEIILVASMLPNPKSHPSDLANRLPYRNVLRRIATTKHTGFVDMLRLHQLLLGSSAQATTCETNGTCSCSDAASTGGDVQTGPKTYSDQTGNDINHPNDWLDRWYAQETAALLLP